MYFYNLTSKRKVYSVRKSTNMLYLQNNVEKGKTKAAARVIPVHPLIKPIIEKLKASSKDEFLIRGINSGGYDKKRSWNFQKKLGRLRKKIGIPYGINFHTLRNTFPT
jgi:integrase